MGRRWAVFTPFTLTETPARACRCTATWPRTREDGLWVSPVSSETLCFSGVSHGHFWILRCSSGDRTVWPISPGSGATIVLGLETWRTNSGLVCFKMSFYNHDKPPRDQGGHIVMTIMTNETCSHWRQGDCIKIISILSVTGASVVLHKCK